MQLVQHSAMPRRIGHKRARARRKTFFREWRDYRNLTLEKAAALLDMSGAQLSRIENGKSDWTWGFLEALAEAYGADPDSLLNRHPSPKKRSTSDEIQAIMRASNEDQRAEIVELARVVTRRARR